MPTSRHRHYRITLGDSIGAHERALSHFGGRPGIHDLGLVESAIARPYCGYYRPIYKKAAALLHSVTTNHGFIDGNKRTAFYFLYLFLEKSGYYIENKSQMEPDEEIEHLILDATTKFLNFDEIVNWIKTRIQRSP